MEQQQERPIRAVIYSRVSTDEQVIGHSLEAQRNSCNHFIQSRGWHFVAEYREEGASGKSLDRPQMQRMLNDARHKKFDMIVSYKLDRLSRNIMDFHKFWNELEVLKIDFSTPTQMIDTSTSSGKLMINILLSFAQFEREQIGERSRMGTEQRVVRQGKWRGGRAPFGYKSDLNLKTIFPLKSEADIVRIVFEKRDQGMAKADIADWLNVQGHRKRASGKAARLPKFILKDIESFLLQPVYWGHQVYRKEYLPSNHEPLLDEQTCLRQHNQYVDRMAQRVTKELNAKSKRNRNKHGKLFQGILFDGDSAEAMTVEQAKGSDYFYYVSNGKRKIRGGKALRVASNEIEPIVLEAIDCLSTSSAVMARVADTINGSSTDQLSSLHNEKRNLEKNRKAVIHKLNEVKIKRSQSNSSSIVSGELKKTFNEIEMELQKINNSAKEIDAQITSLSAGTIEPQEFAKDGSFFLRCLNNTEPKHRPTFCRCFIKRIEIKKLSEPPVESRTGAFVNERQEIVFPSKRKEQKRTLWLSMKIEMRQGVDFSAIFTDEAKVRISDKYRVGLGVTPDPSPNRTYTLNVSGSPLKVEHEVRFCPLPYKIIDNADGPDSLSEDFEPFLEDCPGDGSSLVAVLSP